MLPASLAAWVPLFMATPRSAWARAGASFVPSPIMATSRPPCCSLRMYASFASGRRLGDVVVHPGLGGDALGRQRVVAGHHDGADAHLPQPLEPLADARLEDVLQHHQPDDPVALGDQQRRRPLAGDRVDLLLQPRRRRCRRAARTYLSTASDAPLRITRPSGRSTPLIRVWAVNATNRAPAGAAAAGFAPGVPPVQFDDALALRRLVGRARQGGQLADLGTADTSPSGTNRSALRLPIVIVPVLSSSSVSTSPGHLDRLAALGDQVGPQGPVHAGDADGRQQGPDGGRDQAHQQGHQRRDVGAEALEVLGPEVVAHVRLGVRGHRPQGGDHDQEDQGERRQHQRQGDLVRASAAGPPLRPGRSCGRGTTSRPPPSRGRRSRSDSTRVPPVTPERSPPASRTTGADSPVMADSSTLATPATISPSAGMNCPASTTTRSPACRPGGRHLFEELPGLAEPAGRACRSARPRCPATCSRWAGVSCRVLRRASAWAFPRASASASAKLANSTVRNSHTSRAIR